MAKTSAIRVRTRFESIDDFVVGYSPFFDAKGIFIRTRRVQDVGTRMRFELQLADGRAAFRGEGVVDEVREPPMSASGMHLRISRLDRNSKELFERITSDTDYISQDPFEAPTYDPDKPNVVMAGAAARVLDAAAQGSQVVQGPRAEEPSPELAPIERASAETAPSADDDSPLDASVLDEIADGIELSLDAVWSAGDGGLGGAADLGGYFGSPDVLEKAGMTPSGGLPAIASSPPAAEAVASPAFDVSPGVATDAQLPQSQPHEAVPAHATDEALALEPGDSFHLSSPGADDRAIDESERLVFLEDDEFVADEVIEGEPLEADDIVGDDAFATEEPDAEDDLGIDHALALASAYTPEADEDDDAVLFDSEDVVAVDADVPTADVAEEATEPAVAEAATHAEDEPAAPREEGPDLRSLASATLEHDPIGEEETHRRYVFGTDEQPALGNLIHDLIDADAPEEEGPGLDLSLLAGEDERDAASDGPDAIDELLARESVSGEREEKRGFFKRLFGKKK